MFDAMLGYAISAATLHLQSFEDNIKDFRLLISRRVNLDRRLANELSFKQWIDIAKDATFQTGCSD
jgi:hypothetical protein